MGFNRKLRLEEVTESIDREGITIKLKVGKDIDFVNLLKLNEKNFKGEYEMISRFCRWRIWTIRICKVLNRFVDTGYFVVLVMNLKQLGFRFTRKTKTGECFIKGYWEKLKKKHLT